MIRWLKSLFAPKKQYVSKKEIKHLYKGMSKNQLIKVISALVHENAELKNRKQKPYFPKVIEKTATDYITPKMTKPCNISD